MARRPRPWAIWQPALRGCWIATVLLWTGFTAAGPRETEEVKAVRRAGPAVVNIHGQKLEQSPGKATSMNQVNGMGTAVIIDKRGYMVTNFHVVEDVQNLRATLDDDRTVPVRVVARDRQTDIAVLKVDVAEDLPVIELGTSSDLMVAEPVLAIGNPYGYKHTVTRGVISALHRSVPVTDEFSYYDLIQTDASINPGNSGGPLINAEGKMIGLNVAVRVGAQGIAFAIPVDNVLDAASEMVQRQVNNGASLGLVLEDGYCDDGRYLQVKGVLPDSRANDTIESNDILVAIGGNRVQSKLDVALALIGSNAEPLSLEVRRDGEVKKVAVAPSATQTKLVANVSQNTAAAQRIWDLLGVQVVPVSKTELVRSLGKVVAQYGGGLKVVQVRRDSIAEKRGIQADDILVGIHTWQLTRESDLDWVINRPDLYQEECMFYLGHEGQMMEGKIQLVERKTQRRVR